MKRRTFHSLGARLTFIFSAVILPLLLILIAIGSYAKAVVLSQVDQSYRNLLDSNMRMIDRSLDDITSNMLLIANQDDNFQKLGTFGLSESDYFFAQMELLQRNSAYQSYYHTVDMYFVFSVPNDKLVTTTMPGESPAYVEGIRGKLDELFRRPEQIHPLFYKWNVMQLNGDYFLLRVVGDEAENKAYIGVLINVNSLLSPLSNLNLGEEGKTRIVGDDGTVYSHAASASYAGPALPAERLARAASFEATSANARMFVVHTRSTRSAFHIAVVLPRADLLKGLEYFQQVITFLPLVVFLILLLFLFIIRRLILKPIRVLLGVIRKVQAGDMNVRLPATRNLDFAIIHRSFNGMLEEIGHLKIDVYEERLRSQQAELKQLQTQIHPHFFLNTLNVIFQLADMKRIELVKKTVRHMVQYFRFLMNVKLETVTIEQELAHIEHYLEIQRMRYQESFAFAIQVDDRLRDVRIPSLVVQPFVENAMIHGFSVANGPFRLRIEVAYAEGSGDALAVTVEDNGPGFAADKLAALNDDGYSPDTDEPHIGVWNVKRRLQIRYKAGAAGVRFANREPRGAVVRLILPVEGVEKEG